MVKPIKVLYMIDIIDGNLGGTENQLIKMINGLNKSKFEVRLACFHDAPWLKANISFFHCRTTIIRMNKFTNPSAVLGFLRLIKFIKNYDPDIVQTFFPVGNSVGVLAARLAGVRNIISSRRDYGEWMNSRYLLATRVANNFAKKIIANSTQVQELTQESEKERNGKVGVILNGIDVSKFKNSGRDLGLKKRLKIPEHDKVVGIVANFRPMKHHYTFIKAAIEILNIRKDVSFVLIGEGELHHEIIAYGKSLEIGHKLHFTGSQQEVLPYLSIMDVGVNCSEREGLSNAVMEYMAAGVPCVVSDAGGNPDLITHEINGYVFKLDDYNALAKLVLRLLDDEATRQRFIKKSREKIEKEMSVEAMLSQYEGLYGSLVEMN